MADPHAEARLGRMLFQQNDLIGAERAFRRAAEMDPSIPAYRAKLADVLHRLDRSEAAVDILRQLIAGNIADPHVYARLGHLLAKSGDLPGAERAFRTAAETDPKIPAFRTALLNVFKRQGRHYEALAGCGKSRQFAVPIPLWSHVFTG